MDNRRFDMHGTVHSIENSVKPLLTRIKQVTNYRALKLRLLFYFINSFFFCRLPPSNDVKAVKGLVNLNYNGDLSKAFDSAQCVVVLREFG